MAYNYDVAVKGIQSFIENETRKQLEMEKMKSTMELEKFKTQQAIQADKEKAIFQAEQDDKKRTKDFEQKKSEFNWLTDLTKPKDRLAEVARVLPPAFNSESPHPLGGGGFPAAPTMFNPTNMQNMTVGDSMTQPVGPEPKMTASGVTLEQPNIKDAIFKRIQEKESRGLRLSKREAAFKDDYIGGSQAEQSKQYFANSTKLRNEFDDLSKDFRIVRGSYSRILSLSQKPSAAGDLGLIFSYMKLLDPPSTVREGEQATAEQARGVPDRIRNLYNKVVTGQKLTPEQRADFVERAKEMYSSLSSLQKKNIERYNSLATEFGIDPKDVTTDLFDITNSDSVESEAEGEAVKIDQELIDKVQEALDAGYSQEEINAYLRGRK